MMYHVFPCILFTVWSRPVFSQYQIPLRDPLRSTYRDSSHSTASAALDIWTRNGTRNATAPLLGGIFFEDIANSGDGGLYAELIRNRAFQGSAVTVGHIDGLPYVGIVASENPTVPFGPILDPWRGIGDVRLSLDYLHPLSDALQVALQVDVFTNATGQVGILNEGFWGMQVSPQTYNASFYIQANGARFNYTIKSATAALQSYSTGQIWASSTVDVSNLTPYKYQHYQTQLVNTAAAPNSDNVFTITFDADEVRGQTLYFDLVSLFPETFKDRPNGLRKDLAKSLNELDAKYLRFPGGNNLEGYSIGRRWKWWETIGPLVNRPGRPGDWSYYNTDGLGLLEYLEWTEDMDLEPLLCIYAGFSLELAMYDTANSTDGNEYPLSEMPAVLQEALDELEYCMGSTDTYWGAKRAHHGHSEPFNIPMIEIGNEDFFSHNYPERAAFMYEGLKKVYPNITYVYTAYNEPVSEFPEVVIPAGAVWDAHVYDDVSYFVNSFDLWDNWQAHHNLDSAGTSLMEYHVNFINNDTFDPGNSFSTEPITHPRMISAVAEAVYSLGGERNPKTYRLQAYAPVMQNWHAWRRTGYLMAFDADPANTVLSTSYWQTQMFNRYHGTQTLPITASNGDLNPLFWQASIQLPEHCVYLKIVNAGSMYERLNFNIDTKVTSWNGTTLHSSDPVDLNEFNYIGNTTAVSPRPITDIELKTSVTGHSSNFTWDVPPYSVNVIQLDVAR